MSSKLVALVRIGNHTTIILPLMVPRSLKLCLIVYFNTFINVVTCHAWIGQIIISYLQVLDCYYDYFGFNEMHLVLKEKF